MDRYDGLPVSGAGIAGALATIARLRIAIARALLKKPKNLIFDEAASHPDKESANAIGATINALRGKVTIVLDAHWLPLVLDGVESFHLAPNRLAGHG